MTRLLTKANKAPTLAFGFFAIALACGGAFFGCGNPFDRAYETGVKEKTGQSLYDELLRLDQAYPNQLRVKLDLGARLLAAGDLKGAETYLDRGERLVGPFRFHDPRLVYALYADKAELNLRSGDFKAACAYADKALAGESVDVLGVMFTRAKAESALGDMGAALKDFDGGWAAQKASMSAEDYRSYAIELQRAGRDADAIRVSEDYQRTWPYEPGIGFLESGCHERLGDISAAIVSAFKEYEYNRPFGGISDKALIASLDAAIPKDAGLPSTSRKAVDRLVASLKAFIHGEWKLVTDIPGDGFGEYLGLAARLETGKATVAEVERYILLEPSLKSFQAYYCHLWHGLKKDPRSWSAKSARPLLEKCVSLAPASGMARESRRELGRLIGVGEAAGEKLLVPSESAVIFSGILSGAPFDSLEPVIALLDTPDNDYQAAWVRLLGQLAADPAMKNFLATKAKIASERQRERLAHILSL